MQRENRYSLVKKSLEKLVDYSKFTRKPQPFENVSYYFQNTRNIAFATDTYILYTEIDDQPVAVKIIKMSNAECAENDTSDINNIGTKPIIKPKSTGYNVWREVYCHEKMSPNSSGCPNFPYFYGYFMTRWPNVMVSDYYLHDIEIDDKYKRYLKSREDTNVCMVLLMELFDYNAIEWTNKIHTIYEWKSVYAQMLKAISDLHTFDIVHNDSHAKNFVLKKDGSEWLVALCDFGSVISGTFGDAKETTLYNKIKKSDRDYKLIFYTFNERDIAYYHLMRLKRIQTIEYLQREFPELIEHVKKEHSDIHHTLYWLKLTEIMSYNLENFYHLIDKNKLPPLEISDAIEKIRLSIKPEKPIDKSLLRFFETS